MLKYFILFIAIIGIIISFLYVKKTSKKNIKNIKNIKNKKTKESFVTTKEEEENDISYDQPPFTIELTNKDYISELRRIGKFFMKAFINKLLI